MDEEDDGGGGIPEWVVTFGDMMSLLLTFFIMLVSLSEIKEEEKYQALVESVRQKFGHDLAQLSLGSRQRINKILSEWREQGIIELEGHRYIVRDKDALVAETRLKDPDK